MTESEILEQAKALSIERRIRIIETIWQTINHDMYAITSSYKPASFGEAIVAFRQKHHIDQLDLNPDDIWGNIRDKSIVGQAHLT